MIDHMGVTVRDLAKSKAFYSSALGALGYVPFTTDPDAIGYGVRQGHGKTTDPGGEFWLSEGVPMAPCIHFAFNAESPAHVDAFHAAGVAAGGTNNGAPGLRAGYHPHYYAAFLLDPDGYNIEAVCHLETV